MTNPCPHCNDATDHKTPEALSACTAGLEGWVFRYPGISSGVCTIKKFWYDRAGRHHVALPDYLNDPAETVRMLEALYRRSRENFIMEFDGEYKACLTTSDTHNWFHGELESTIHRAYHAMRLSEWMAKQETKKGESQCGVQE